MGLHDLTPEFIPHPKYYFVGPDHPCKNCNYRDDNQEHHGCVYCEYTTHYFHVEDDDGDYTCADCYDDNHPVPPL